MKSAWRRRVRRLGACRQMDEHRFFVEKLRFHIKNKNQLVFVGWFFDGSTKGHRLLAGLDGRELPLLLQVNKGAEVRQKYIRSINEIEEEVVGVITLPDGWKQGKRLAITASYRKEMGEDAVSTEYAVSVKKLCRLEREICYYIENCHRENDEVTVTGWSMADGGVTPVLVCGDGREFPQTVTRYYRRDLLPVFPESDEREQPGFLVRAEVPEAERGPFYLELRAGGRRERIRIHKWDEGTRLQYIVGKMGDTVRYLERNGMSATLYKIQGRLRKKEGNSYENWRKKYLTPPEELERQRQTHFAREPLFSIVVPLYRTKPEYLRELIDSVRSQTYGNWQLCIAHAHVDDADGGQTSCDDELTAILKEYACEDPRICWRALPENLGIAGNTDAAIALATGEFLVLADHDDLLAPDALYELAAAIDREPETDVLYSDEDKVSMDGKKYFEPHFKPDFSLDLLCSMNYICHLFAVRRDVAKRAGGFRKEYEGAQDLDFILRCSECAGRIVHVPKILYHWRCHMDSTAANPESKRYAFEAGRRAVEAHYQRCGIPARVENAQFYGMYRTVYEWETEPLVSVIIPNKDHAADLKKCLDSIYGKSDYRNFECVIVENNSTEPETFDFYKTLEAEHENLRVVFYEGGFNFSKINNFGAAAARGDYFLLLNNDTEMIGSDCIRELLGYCMREDVGAVGAKLLYEDGTIQHAGVVVGFGGTAGHAFIGKSRYDTGYFGRILCAQDYSAVTAACMMTKRSVFEAVGGLTEELAVAFNDVDYCLKVREYGKLVVYNPYAELFHYESRSRGYEDSPEKVERFNGETEQLLNRWRGLIEAGDPCYNRNLTLDNSDFSLRR